MFMARDCTVLSSQPEVLVESDSDSSRERSFSLTPNSSESTHRNTTIKNPKTETDSVESGMKDLEENDRHHDNPLPTSSTDSSRIPTVDTKESESSDGQFKNHSTEGDNRLPLDIEKSYKILSMVRPRGVGLEYRDFIEAGNKKGPNKWKLKRAALAIRIFNSLIQQAEPSTSTVSCGQAFALMGLELARAAQDPRANKAISENQIALVAKNYADQIIERSMDGDEQMVDMLLNGRDKEQTEDEKKTVLKEIISGLTYLVGDLERFARS